MNLSGELGRLDFNIGGLLAERSQLHPDKVALVFEGKVFSYKELNERSSRWANAFLALGAKKGDRVGLLLPNCNEFLEAYFGLAKIGVILVMLNWRLTALELEYICKNSGLKKLVFGAEFAQTVDALRLKLENVEYVCVGGNTPEWSRDANFVYQRSSIEPRLAASGEDPLFIMYTSGTTGRPKGAVLTHNAAFGYGTTFLATYDIRPDDRILVLLPLFHMGGFINGGMVWLYRGCTLVLMRSSPLEPGKVLETIEKWKIDQFIAVPTVIQRIVQAPDSQRYLSSVRFVIIGGAPLTLPLIEACLSRGVRVRQVYAATEAFATAMDEKHLTSKPGSAGKVALHHEVRIVDEKGADVPINQVGEILVKGPTLMKEYWNDPEGTAQAVKNGFWWSGDLVRLDEDGYIYVVDRRKDMIITGGENVYPAEVENVLEAHPKIAEVAVIGRPDQLWGESVCAVVRPKDGETLTLQDITQFCQGKLAHFKTPRHLILTDQPLPRGGPGKVLKRVLREQYKPIHTEPPKPTIAAEQPLK